MKNNNCCFLSCRYIAIVLLLCLGILFMGGCAREVQVVEEEPEKKIEEKQGTEYDVIFEYLPEDMRENLRLQTEEEREMFPALWPSVSPEENAAFCYLRAINFMSDERAPLGSSSNRGKYDEKTLKEWVEKNKKSLEEVKKAQRFSTCQFPVLIDAEYDVLFPAGSHLLMGLRQLARTCLDAGFVAELDGNNDEAAQWYLTCLKMGVHLRKDSTHIENLVGLAITTMGYTALGVLIVNSPISDNLLEYIISECSTAQVTSKEIVQVLRKEAATELWRYSKTEERKNLGKSYEQSEGDDIFATMNKGLRAIARMSDEEFNVFLDDIPILYGELQDISRNRLAELVKPDFELEGMLSGRFRSDAYRLFYDLYPQWYRLLAKENVNLGALQIRAAIALYQKENEKPPDSLEDLCPKWLPEVPMDPFSGEPMKYLRKSDKWLVYSVGEDGEDDGGQGTVWSSGPDIVFRSDVESNIESRKEWGEIYSPDEEDDDTQPEFEEPLPDFLWESDMPPSDIPSTEGSDE